MGKKKIFGRQEGANLVSLSEGPIIDPLDPLDNVKKSLLKSYRHETLFKCEAWAVPSNPNLKKLMPSSLL